MLGVRSVTFWVLMPPRAVHVAADQPVDTYHRRS